MKKSTVILAALMAISTVFTAQVQAEPSAKDIKKVQKVAKARAKELTKQGWVLQGSTPLETKLEKHLIKLTDFGGTATEFVATSEGNMDIDMGVTEATSNAAQYYAQNAGSMVKGRIVSQKDKISDEQSKNFVAAFEQLVVKEIKGEFNRSFVLVKETKNGKKKAYDVQVFYLLDEEAASSARIRALKQAAAEAKIAEELGQQISDYINAGFNE